MLSGLDWDIVESVLEPSAGKGNLVECVLKAATNSRHGRRVEVDCVEIDPYLRQILKYNFSDERKAPLRKRLRELENTPYSERTESDRREIQRLSRELESIHSDGIRVVHDDFLTFQTEKHYDLIIMNPPFANGDKHLLKALEVQKNGGSIVCLLNAETIINPYTNTRELLKRELDRRGAKIQFVDGGFKNAERKTDVQVAIVRVDIPHVRPHSTIYERMEQAAQAEQRSGAEVHDLVTGDYIEQAVQRYKVEVAATTELIREYEALCPYMSREIAGDKDPLLTLVIERESVYSTLNINEYMRRVRLKYWRALFKNEQFTGKLTSNLRKQYMETVEKMANYEFSLFNIQQVMTEMNSGIIDGVKQTILDLFDKLTVEHSWYPECKENRHYFNGWAANKAHKVGKKSIIPTCGIFTTQWDGSKSFSVSEACSVISDIEKAFDYLDGKSAEPSNLHGILQEADLKGQMRNIECRYFKVDLFKKGTTHIKFTNMDLVEKLNIYAARNKNWLPPNYGRTTYENMDAGERDVIDSFQGKEEYARVMAMPGYFLSEPTKGLALLQA